MRPLVHYNPDIWKCVEYIQQTDDDFAEKFANVIALLINGDTRQIANFQSDVNHEIIDKE